MDNKTDLRIVKTHKVLLETMLNLLSRQKFTRITVNGLCEAAQVSRATFYAHFNDKYDLLRFWLNSLKQEIAIKQDSFYINIEKTMNRFLIENKKIITHLLDDSDDETIRIMFEFILSLSDIVPDKTLDNKTDPQYVVLSNFYAGGFLYYLFWMVRNKFPESISPMNIYLYETMKKLREQYK